MTVRHTRFSYNNAHTFQRISNTWFLNPSARVHQAPVWLVSIGKLNVNDSISDLLLIRFNNYRSSLFSLNFNFKM